MDNNNLMLVVAGGGLFVFLTLLRWAVGPLLPRRDPTRDPMLSAYWNLYTDPEKPWVGRARTALAKLPPPPRLSGELEGWSWQPVDRDPAMTVRIDDRSSDGRRISGYIIGTAGTLAVACSASTDLRIVDGWITLTPDGSPSMTLKAGDSLVLHPGFRGRWQNETLAHVNFQVMLR